MQFAAAKNYDFEILQAVEGVNERQKVRLLAQDEGALRRR